jgi:PAS domain S-box-containing protein
MTDPTRILIVEDSPADALLMERELRRTQLVFATRRVEDQAGFRLALDEFAPAVVLSDHSLPQFSAREVLRICHVRVPDVPVIIVTGSLDEETAADYIKAGATDYVVKDHLQRLGPAVHRALALTSALRQERLAQERVVASETRLRAILEAALDGVVTIDGAGTIVSWNNQAEAMFGWKASEAVGRNLAETIIPPRDREQHQRGLAEARETGTGPLLNRRTEIMGLRRDGSEIPLELAITPIRAGNQWMFSAFIRDLTERKRAEEALRATETRLAQVISASVAVIYATRVAGDRFVPNWVSENVTRLTGYQLQEALGLTWWSDHVHPEDREATEKELAQSLQSGLFQAEYRFQFRDGSYHWILDEARLVRDPQGRPLELIGTWFDITERKQLEIQLRQAQKMEAVGQLAGGIAHDFNNVLTAISGNADLLQDQFPVGDPRLEDVNEIRAAVARAAALTHQLLAFSRRQVLQPRVLDLGEVIAATKKMLQRIIGEDIELVSTARPEAGRVRADPGQLEQVILNLVVNARDAMPGGGKVTIETGAAYFDAAYAHQHPPATEGAYVMLAVSDTGKGMTPEIKSRLFEPFFTTKEVGKGTGLGLATVYGIVKQSGGFIWVYSEPGHGTTFKVYLPRAEDAPAMAAPAEPQPVASGGSETILLVEDDAPVRKVARDILIQCGYKVLEARRPEEAAELNRTYPDPIQLVVSDVIMPGISGRDLALELTTARPGLKVLLVSGYPGVALEHQGVLTTGRAFLSKPFTAQALAAKVRSVLDGRDP